MQPATPCKEYDQEISVATLVAESDAEDVHAESDGIDNTQLTTSEDEGTDLDVPHVAVDKHDGVFGVEHEVEGNASTTAAQQHIAAPPSHDHNSSEHKAVFSDEGDQQLTPILSESDYQDHQQQVETADQAPVGLLEVSSLIIVVIVGDI